MSQQTAARILERPPLYWEAVAYCEERGIPPEDIERARTMLAVREFTRRVEPWQQQAARLMAAAPVKWIQSEGYARPDTSREMDQALKAIQDLIDLEAEKLGLAVPDRP